jgi:hypothetical protein
LFEKNIDRVFDSQPLGNSAILKAIRIYNKKRNKHLILEKIVVDLPTPKSSHFFQSIKRLSKENRKLIRLITIEPLLDKHKSDEAFWQFYCKIPLSQVSYEKYVIRQKFREKMEEEKVSKTENLFIRYKTAKEASVIRKILKIGKVSFSNRKDRFVFSIPKEAVVLTILLGSHPSLKGTFGYIKNLSTSIKTCKKDFFIFAFCGECFAKPNLFSQIAILLSKEKINSHIKIIPMSYQQEDVIASLFSRSNITITRAGGQTAMELMALEMENMWIHSEAKETFTLEDLLKGIPAWEAGNAVYLLEKNKAKIVTPETFVQPLIKQLQKKKICSKELIED